MNSEPVILRHDNPEAALPHQVDPPAAWGLKLPDPVAFEVSLPKWCPMDADALVSLHWWASLATHLMVLTRSTENQEKVRYRVDKAMRETLAMVKAIYGPSVSAAVSTAASLSLASVDAKDELRETGCWTMAVQVSFGLLCARATAKGFADPIVGDLRNVFEWIKSAFLERLGDEQAFRLLMAVSTGTETFEPEEKLVQFTEALARASEGAPEGLPALEEALAATEKVDEVLESGADEV